MEQVFQISGKGGSDSTVAGCRVTTGSLKADASVQVVRKGEVVYEGKMQSLRFKKEIVKQVRRTPKCEPLVSSCAAVIVMHQIREHPCHDFPRVSNQRTNVSALAT